MEASYGELVLRDSPRDSFDDICLHTCPVSLGEANVAVASSGGKCGVENGPVHGGSKPKPYSIGSQGSIKEMRLDDSSPGLPIVLWLHSWVLYLRGHDEPAVVADPGRRLVSTSNPEEVMIASVEPPAASRACLRTPMIKAPR